MDKPETKVDSVLVVGGAGYIGSVLTGMLLNAGCSVRVLDKLLYDRGPAHNLGQRPNFELIESDFGNVGAIVPAV